MQVTTPGSLDLTDAVTALECARGRHAEAMTRGDFGRAAEASSEARSIVRQISGRLQDHDLRAYDVAPLDPLHNPNHHP